MQEEDEIEYNQIQGIIQKVTEKIQQLKAEIERLAIAGEERIKFEEERLEREKKEEEERLEREKREEENEREEGKIKAEELENSGILPSFLLNSRFLFYYLMIHLQ